MVQMLNTLASQQVWRKRMEDIDDTVQDLLMPTDIDGDTDQDQEWCEIVIDNKTRRVRFHDYDQVYDVPGLYEKIFYDALKCSSPSYVVNLFKDVAGEWGVKLNDLKVLDVGAGNGMVADELRHRGVDKVVGVDIIEEAKQAALRDRPDVYDDYRVADLTDLPQPDEEALRKHGLNCMTTVAALGYGDIPPAAFLKALDMIDTPAWLAFNIKEDFLHESDQSGFSRLIRRMIQQDYIQPQCYRRYRHRLSVTGEPLYYIAMIATKCKPVESTLFTEFA
ncbi:MAG: class I SAM-dependent methyltransferase [Gammaproteobacteria bacterium]|jgi:SAM-dependent methyltransferase